MQSDFKHSPVIPKWERSISLLLETEDYYIALCKNTRESDEILLPALQMRIIDHADKAHEITLNT